MIGKICGMQVGVADRERGDISLQRGETVFSGEGRQRSPERGDSGLQRGETAVSGEGRQQSLEREDSKIILLAPMVQPVSAKHGTC